MDKRYDGVFAYCKKMRLPEVDDACCVFDDCELFKGCHPEEWEKLNVGIKATLILNPDDPKAEVYNVLSSGKVVERE